VSEKTDNWSFGCLLYAMAFGGGPFENETEGVLTLNIRNGVFKFPVGHGSSRKLCEMILRLLERDPEARAALPDLILWMEEVLGGGDPFEGAYAAADPAEAAAAAAARAREEAERRAALQEKLRSEVSGARARAAAGGRGKKKAARAASPQRHVPVAAPATAFAEFAAFPANGNGGESSGGGAGFADFGEATEKPADFAAFGDSNGGATEKPAADFAAFGDDGNGFAAFPNGEGDEAPEPAKLGTTGSDDWSSFQAGLPEAEAPQIRRNPSLISEDWGDFNEVDEQGNQQQL